VYGPLVKLEGEMQLGRTCSRCKVIVEITLNGEGGGALNAFI
jgi:phage FluMu protein Com